MKGTVLKSTGSWYLVLTESGIRTECRIKGKFRLDDSKNTNPVAVGDKVVIELEQNSEQGSIITIEPRKNYIIRRSINLSRQTHILAANIDRAFLLVTLAMPRTSLGFIDRFLITAEAYRIPVDIIFNKADLYDEKMVVKVENLKTLYESLGYPCHILSALKEGPETEFLRKRMKGNINLFSGHSGTGKSTLINTLDPALRLKTGGLSEAHDKGVHTTTFAEMFELTAGGFIIDSPGIKELGIVDMEKAELSHFFPEMRRMLNTCRFNNCQHLTEPKCAVRDAVKNGEIAASRYESYIGIMSGEELEKEYE
ncbi:MAG: ribosome small subunit-dependent GTPase A [Bacteroidia bacterium]